MYVMFQLLTTLQSRQDELINNLVVCTDVRKPYETFCTSPYHTVVWAVHTVPFIRYGNMHIMWNS